MNEVASHLIQAGGKRLRPSLTITASYLKGNEVTADILLGAVSVELVHLASLYHDDVMDEATRRRSVESVNARWGNLVAIVAGDFLLARRQRSLRSSVPNRGLVGVNSRPALPGAGGRGTSRVPDRARRG